MNHVFCLLKAYISCQLLSPRCNCLPCQIVNKSDEVFLRCSIHPVEVLEKRDIVENSRKEIVISELYF